MPNRAMQNNNQHNRDPEHNTNRTPLEMVRAHQAMIHRHHDVTHHPDMSPEVPGNSTPSDRRHHPQRQMYNGGRH
jgi:hypothetical protein